MKRYPLFCLIDDPDSQQPACGGKVHLWMRDIGESGQDAHSCREILSPTEKQRADRFRFDTHRDRFVRGRAFLREIVAQFYKCEPSELMVVEGSDGKPLVPGSAVAFNLSHSGDIAVLGVAPMKEIGVDVETFDRNVECVSIAKRFFAESEFRAVKAQPSDEQRELFFRLWTSKEAAMKATGEGLRIDPRLVEVDLDHGLRPRKYRGRFESWHLANEDISGAGVTVSVAAPEPFAIVWES